MKKKTQSSIFLILIMGIFLVSITSCKKDDDKELLSKESPSPTNATNGKTTAVFNPNVTYGTMTDQEGNIYKTVTIGTQTWMAENLRTTKYNDGTNIPNIPDTGKWDTLTIGAYNTDDNTDINTIATHGRLYNWFAVNNGKLAPKGWHVPSDAEWTTLTTYLGGEDIAGNKLKETGISHWNAPNTGATNETGFTALPLVTSYGHWWSTTEIDATIARGRSMDYNAAKVFKETYSKRSWLPIRCVKD